MIELAEAVGAPAEMRRREAAAILAAVPSGGFLVALDLGGDAPDTERFAALLDRWATLGRPLAWAIGGAEGLDPAVLSRADHVLSLGRLTWPHLLVRVLLAEQVFRARSLLAGHPYHRPWRP